MKVMFFLTIYNLVYPVFLFLSLPGYLLKMYRRGGYGTGLKERFGFYTPSVKEEPKGVIYVHAVSVGEVLIGLKWIKNWLESHPEDNVVLATSTSTGHEIARNAAVERVRVLYSPLDLPGLPGRCLDRFTPRVFVLVEAEIWPNMGLAARQRGIPQIMINARLSTRSERRYKKVLPLTKILYGFLDKICVQNEEDAGRFEGIGVDRDKIEVTGSIKFDNKGAAAPQQREEFAQILNHLRREKPVILIASTHSGEEVVIAKAVRSAGAFPLIVPRHAERRQSVVKELTEDGWAPLLRTETNGMERLPSNSSDNVCYIADTTGELRDWTAHADIAIIGKSFLSKGGQNPAEAIAAKVPVVTGQYMGNFQALVDLLIQVEGINQCTLPELESTLQFLLDHPEEARAQTERAFQVLEEHEGATEKTSLCVDKMIK